MPGKFLDGVSGKLADQWVATLLTPAFMFWAGGLIAYCDCYGINTITKWFEQYTEPLQIGILVTALGVVTASAFIAQRFDTEILRVLEGYWHPSLRFLLIPCTEWQKYRRKSLIKKLKRLNSKISDNTASVFERSAFVQCDRALHQFPEKEYDILPTRLGNILRAAERRPYYRYGLDSIICWPRLWLLLPESVKKDLQAAQSEINNAVRLFFWSMLFLIWIVWSMWAIPAALIASLFAYYWILDEAEVYAVLIESTFDLHRQLLYKGLRWELPDDPEAERRVGKQLNDYLWRGKVSS